MPSHPTGGVKCFSVGGRMIYERQRCLGMVDEERRWRAQWLKDQVLSPDEPRYVPEYYKETTNFIRRLWISPMNKLQKSLEPSLGVNGAYLMRHFIGTAGLLYAGALCVTYFLLFNTNDFTTGKAFDFYMTRKPMFPHEPGYPDYPVKRTTEYYDQGFYSSVLCQDVEPLEQPPPPPPPSPPPPVPEETVPCPFPVEE